MHTNLHMHVMVLDTREKVNSPQASNIK